MYYSRKVAGIILVTALFAPGISPTRADEVQRGEETYRNYCLNCHGSDAAGLEAFQGDLAAFRVAIAGTANMPDLSGVVSEQEVAEVFAYVTSRVRGDAGHRP